MNKNGDKELIKKLINWAITNDFNQSQLALAIRRTRAWASLLINGKIKRLNFDTRNRAKKLIGGFDEQASNPGRDS